MVEDVATPDADFLPTHVIPSEGLAAWEAPDVSRPTVPLDALLPVQLVERRGDWGRIVCFNGWSAWVDGRLLVPVPQAPPVSAAPPTRSADLRRLLARVMDALERYGQATDELAAGRADGETFRERTEGLRAGVVIAGEAAWLYDVEEERWMYCDGGQTDTWAVSSAPSADETPAPSRPSGGTPERTRIVDWPGDN
ncbi:hypothetical protein ACIP2X_13160 [Streptomyces sp. NPDC089424]|uniref:hypothetical protein n=1 Tax=Streptomyces sp. NPDC089424 TaxID=3365917 RepID=UPI003809EA46